MKPLTPEAIARIREEWQEEIRNEKPKRVVVNNGRPARFTVSMLDDLMGMSIAEQAAELGCSRRTIEKLRHEHEDYADNRKSK